MPAASGHRGGLLHVWQGERWEIVDFGKAAIESEVGAPWAAFRASCSQRVAPFVSGCRVVVVFTLTLPSYETSPDVVTEKRSTADVQRAVGDLAL